MPERGSCDWQLRPSRRQRWLDGLTLAMPFLMAWRIWAMPSEFVQSEFMQAGVISLLLLGSFMALMMVMNRLSWPEHDIQRIGLDTSGWWLQRRDTRVRVDWKTHSFKRRHLVVLRWSVWPWHTLVLRPDSFVSEQEFRRFKARLYGYL